jgi:hypothetical protein
MDCPPSFCSSRNSTISGSLLTRFRQSCSQLLHLTTSIQKILMVYMWHPKSKVSFPVWAVTIERHGCTQRAYRMDLVRDVQHHPQRRENLFRLLNV